MTRPTQPIVHDYLTQIFVKHYSNQPKQAAENALKFMEIIELYGMEMIVGEWQQRIEIEPKSPWEIMLETAEEAAEREPWKAYELNN